MELDFIHNIALKNRIADKKLKAKLKTKIKKEKKYDIDGVKILIKEIKVYRKRMELPNLNIKVRQCLRCFNKFKSINNGNRMCDKCKRY